MQYQAYYCEENVWHLCQEPSVGSGPRLAVVISSLGRVCPIWQQRASPADGQPVLWDYHVILLHRAQQTWEVWDLDTLLGMPRKASEYISLSFLPPGQLSPDFEPCFRVMDADQYRNVLSTDRSHMRDDQGHWQAPPPAWKAPFETSRGMNLPRMWDMEDDFCGTLMDLATFRARYS